MPKHASTMRLFTFGVCAVAAAAMGCSRSSPSPADSRTAGATAIRSLLPTAGTSPLPRERRRIEALLKPVVTRPCRRRNEWIIMTIKSPAAEARRPKGYSVTYLAQKHGIPIRIARELIATFGDDRATLNKAVAELIGTR